MKKGSIVDVRAPNSSNTRRAKVLGTVETNNGDWLELAGVDDAGKVIKDKPSFRARPTMCSAA